MSQSTKIFLSFTFVVLISLSFVSTVMTLGLNSGIALVMENDGQPAATAGFLLAVFTVASTIARFLTGDLTDHARHENLLVAGMVVVFFGCALPMASMSMPVLVISRALQGVGFCFLTTVTTVLVAETVPKSLLSTALGYRGLGTALGNAVGPTVAVVTVGLGGGFGLHLATTLMCLVALALTVTLRIRGVVKRSEDDPDPDESAAIDASSSGNAVDADSQGEMPGQDDAPGNMPHSKEAAGKSRSRALISHLFEPSVLPVVFVEFWRRFINGSCTTFAVLYGLSIGIEQAGLFFVAASAAIVCCRLFAGRWMDTASGYLVMAVMCLTCTAGFVLVALAPSTPTFLTAGLFYGVMEGLGSPYLMAVTMRKAPQKHWGVASSNYFLLGDAGTAVGGWLCGALIDHLGYGVVPWFVVAAALITFALSLFLVVPRKRN